jgi:hypothetical protein
MFLNQRQVCQNYVSGICFRGASCPYLHVSSDSQNKESGNYCFFSSGHFFSSENLQAKKKNKKRNIFENFEDIPLKVNKFYYYAN